MPTRLERALVVVALVLAALTLVSASAQADSATDGGALDPGPAGTRVDLVVSKDKPPR